MSRYQNLYKLAIDFYSRIKSLEIPQLKISFNLTYSGFNHLIRKNKNRKLRPIKDRIRRLSLLLRIKEIIESTIIEHGYQYLHIDNISITYISITFNFMSKNVILILKSVDRRKFMFWSVMDKHQKVPKDP